MKSGDPMYEQIINIERMEQAVSLFGSAAPADYEAMTGEICRILAEQLGIPGKNVYVTYRPVSDWGWNGSNF